METLSSEQARQVESTCTPAALLPSQALNRFEPPEGFVPVASGATSKASRYGFCVGNYSLLIRNDVGSEVVAMLPIATVPAAPAWLSGLINLRGNLVPVCDLARVLDTDTDKTVQKPMILVLDKGDNAAGFIIEGLPRSLSGLTPLHHVPTLPDLLARHVGAAYAHEDEIWLEFDHKGFLLDTNW